MSIAAALILSGIFLVQSASADEGRESSSTAAPSVRENAESALAASDESSAPPEAPATEAKSASSDSDAEKAAPSEENAAGAKTDADAPLADVAQAGDSAAASFAAAHENKESGEDSAKKSSEGKSAAGVQARGALLAPLERGGLSYYGTFGYPELKVGFREGMDGFELGAELGFDYTLTDLWLVASGRGSLWKNARRDFSLEGQLGAFGSFGARGLEDRNRPGQGLRLGLLGTFTHGFDLPLLFTATAKIPLEIPLSSTGLLRFGLLLGAGIELPLTDVFVVSLSFEVGPMLWRQYGGVSYFKLGYDIAVGLGFRLF